MNKLQKSLLLIFALMAFGQTAWAQQNPFSGGNGTEETPYLISSAEDWNTLADYVNNGNDDYKASCYQLTPRHQRHQNGR